MQHRWNSTHCTYNLQNSHGISVRWEKEADKAPSLWEQLNMLQQKFITRERFDSVGGLNNADVGSVRHNHFWMNRSNSYRSERKNWSCTQWSSRSKPSLPWNSKRRRTENIWPWTRPDNFSWQKEREDNCGKGCILELNLYFRYPNLNLTFLWFVHGVSLLSYPLLYYFICSKVTTLCIKISQR